MTRTLIVAVVALLVGGALSLALFAKPLCEKGIREKTGKLGGLVSGLLDGLDLFPDK